MTADLELLHRSAVPSVFKEPFIINGYRKPGSSVVQCLKYAFILHNDVGNFWTHFVPLLAWVCWYRCLSIDFTDTYYYPLWCFWAGACSYALFSSLAHLFSTISYTVKTVCFVLDYLGIAMYVFGGSLATLFYQSPVASSLFEYKKTFVFLDMTLAISATVLSSLTRFYWKRYRFTIRILAYVLPYILSVSPFLERFYICVKTGEECIEETLYLHYFGFVAILVLTFFFVSKLPERCAPGRFDYIAQSHQLFHLSAVTITTSQMIMFPLDAKIRREALRNVTQSQADFYTTVFPYMVTQACGLLWVVVVGILVAKGYLHSDKKDK